MLEFIYSITWLHIILFLLFNAVVAGIIVAVCVLRARKARQKRGGMQR